MALGCSRPAHAVVLAVLFVIRPLTAAEPADQWLDLPPLPTARQEVGVAALDGKIYVIGGILANRSPTGVVERFVVDEERWESVPPLPNDTRLHHVGAAAVQGKVYAVGGLDSSFRGVGSVFAFDPAEGSWEQVADLPRVRGAMGVATLGGKIYAAGGQNGGTSLRHFAAYSPEDDRWEELPDLPTARNHLVAASVGSRIYAVSGRAGGLRSEVEAYDPATREWAPRAPIPTARGGMAAAALGGLIFVFGGEGNPSDPLGIFPQIEAYDPVADSWHARPDMAQPRHGIGAAVVGERIYVPGGSLVQGFGVTDVHDALVPDLSGLAGFRRGDANFDAVVDISDPVFTLVDLFVGGPGIPCPDAADANDDGAVDLTDAVFSLDFLFRGGPPPPPPGPENPGGDPTDDGLGCS